MFTISSRFLFALSAATLIGAAAYGLASGGDVIGVISAGYKGGVGDHIGYSILLWTAVGAGVLAGVLTAIRDADPAPATEVDALPEAPAPASVNVWPLVAAFGAALLLVGLVTGPLLFVIGVIVLAAAAIEWTVQAWADRATGDPEVNRRIRNRLMAPIEIPIGAVAIIGFVVLGASRVFIALTKTGAVTAATVAMVLIMGAAALVALRPNLSRSVVSALLLLGGLAVLGGGIAGAVAGERDFEHHGEEHGEEHGEDEGESHSEDGAEVEAETE